MENTKAHRVARKLLADTKYFYTWMILGVYTSMTEHYGVPEGQETCDAIKDVLIEEYFGGCEPEFASKEAWEWFENFGPDYFSRGGYHGDIAWAEDKKPPQSLIQR